jgi:hypothetical protein
VSRPRLCYCLDLAASTRQLSGSFTFPRLTFKANLPPKIRLFWIAVLVGGGIFAYRRFFVKRGGQTLGGSGSDGNGLAGVVGTLKDGVVVAGIVSFLPSHLHRSAQVDHGSSHRSGSSTSSRTSSTPSILVAAVPAVATTTTTTTTSPLRSLPSAPTTARTTPRPRGRPRLPPPAVLARRRLLRLPSRRRRGNRTTRSREGAACSKTRRMKTRMRRRWRCRGRSSCSSSNRTATASRRGAWFEQ